MSMFEQITDDDDPEEIARTANRDRLRRAVATATKRARRSDPAIQDLLGSASVSGQHQNTKTALVSFNASPFRGGLHHFYPWRYLDQLTDSELSVEVSRMLRDDFKRKRRGV